MLSRRLRSTVMLAAVSVVAAWAAASALANTPPVGALEHVSQSWIEGWAADPDDYARPVRVEVYASNTAGDGKTRQVGAQKLGRIGQGVAGLAREEALGRRCAGNSAKGFRIAVRPNTPGGKTDYARAYLLDGRDHTVYAFAADLPSGALVQLGEPFVFRADTLYSQEPIGNINDHILINTPPRYLGFPRSKFGYDVNGADRLLFVYEPPTPWGVEPVAANVSADTGLSPSLPVEQQRAVGVIPPGGKAGCAIDARGVAHFDLAQADGDAAAVLYDSKAFGVPNSGVMVQQAWAAAPRPWRKSGAGDRLRVEGRFTQPKVFADGPSHPANVTFWYFVLLLHDCRNHADIWWCGRVFQSHLISYEPKRDPPKTEGWQYGMAFPDENRTVLSPEMLLVETPVQPQPAGADWLSLCPGSASRTMTAFPQERYYGFEISADQMRRTLEQLERDRQAANQRNPGKPIGPVSTDPADFELRFMVIDIEGWGISDVARIGLKIRGLTVRSLRAPVAYSPEGRVEHADGTAISGWASDRDDFNRPLEVRVYATGVAAKPGTESLRIAGETVTLVGTTVADLPRDAAVAAQCGGNPNHGFSLPTTAALKDGKPHRVFVTTVGYPAGAAVQLVGPPAPGPWQ